MNGTAVCTGGAHKAGANGLNLLDVFVFRLVKELLEVHKELIENAQELAPSLKRQ